jgi:hypothetical protein
LIVTVTRIDDRPHSPGFEPINIALILMFLVFTCGLVRIA